MYNIATVSTNVSYIPLFLYINAATCSSHKMHTKIQKHWCTGKKKEITIKKKFLYSFNYEFHSLHSLSFTPLLSSFSLAFFDR